MNSSEEYTKERMSEMRAKFPHLDNYDAWVAAGKPQPVANWPKAPDVPVVVDWSSVWELVYSGRSRTSRRGTMNVINRISIRRGRR